MNRLQSLTTRIRLLLGLTLPVVLLLIVAASAYRSIALLQQTQDSVYRNEFADAIDLMNYRTDNNGLWASTLNLLYGRRETQVVWQEDIRKRVNKINELLNQLQGRNQNESEFHQSLQELGDLVHRLCRDHVVPEPRVPGQQDVRGRGLERALE